MSTPINDTVSRAATDAFVKAISRETDPWRQARLLAFVRKRREHEDLRKLAEELVHQPETYWGALEILTEPSPRPPAEGPLWIEPVSDMCFVRIPPGRFWMGSDSFWILDGKEEPDGNYHEKPRHEVEISREYWLGRHPVTNGEYGRYLRTGPDVERSEFWENPRLNGPGQPVVGVSWIDSEERYCGWLRTHANLAFHLPTEAEWEYACRAGTETEFSFGDIDEGEIANYGWFLEELSITDFGVPHTVGLKRPNAWGLCDVHGNVFEWCWDWDGDYPIDVQLDPTGPSLGFERVFRGGCGHHILWHSGSAIRRANKQDHRWFDLGFRLALSPIRRPHAE